MPEITDCISVTVPDSKNRATAFCKTNRITTTLRARFYPPTNLPEISYVHHQENQDRARFQRLPKVAPVSRKSRSL